MKTRLIPAHAGKTFSGSPSHAHSKAHPRSRGENLCPPCGGPLCGGSSPLTRGKRRSLVSLVRLHRLIPAHAGKTRQATRRALPSRAHPRSRGENHRRSAPNGVKSGSSPLTRGKHVRETQVQNRLGLIPAHAGKTEKKIESGLGGAAHPRSRGENGSVRICLHSVTGSSPLTRGKPSSCTLRPRTARLIPAHAGKTRLSQDGSTSGAAHPRSRGENSTASARS